MDSSRMAQFLGFSAILTVFTVVSIVCLFLLSKWRITGLFAFGVVYLIWIVVIGVLTFTGGNE